MFAIGQRCDSLKLIHLGLTFSMLASVSLSLPLRPASASGSSTSTSSLPLTTSTPPIYSESFDLTVPSIHRFLAPSSSAQSNEPRPSRRSLLILGLGGVQSMQMEGMAGMLLYLFERGGKGRLVALISSIWPMDSRGWGPFFFSKKIISSSSPSSLILVCVRAAEKCSYIIIFLRHHLQLELERQREQKRPTKGPCAFN
ncbi:hypothetical protein KFK09_025909 [Dendrobium nobile]|uniref:Uncharacterized protein n=1 Tax=Dendrobium nobile TaxID=94219 RepID=A0A8T3A6F6_DENNO|nr:hypothetical protein KFK09_025909 [Dendrobium nobile]